MIFLRMTAHQTLTGFHHLGLSSSNMQTLDKRISASSDQLDCIRGEAAKYYSSDKNVILFSIFRDGGPSIFD